MSPVCGVAKFITDLAVLALLTDTRRTTQFLTGLNTETKLSIYEYNSRDWTIDRDSFPVWPPGLPRADGVFVCYDGSDRASFSDLVKLVGE